MVPVIRLRSRRILGGRPRLRFRPPLKGRPESLSRDHDRNAGTTGAMDVHFRLSVTC